MVMWQRYPKITPAAGGRHQQKKWSPAPIQEFQELKPIWLQLRPQVDSSDFDEAARGFTVSLVKLCFGDLKPRVASLEIREVNFFALPYTAVKPIVASI